MPRAFDTSDIRQHAEHITAAGTELDPGVGLANATTDSPRGGVIVMGAQNPIDPPEQWDAVAASGVGGSGSPQLAIMCRADLPVGDQSWTFTAVAGFATAWAWIAEEWANLSFAPLLGSDIFPLVKDPAGGTVDIGPTAAWDSTEYAEGVAALLMITAIQTGSTPLVWPSVSWSNGFTQTDVLTRGDGLTDTDMRLIVARKYGEAGDTGAWSTTATLSPGTAGQHNCYGALAAFRAEHFVGEA